MRSNEPSCSFTKFMVWMVNRTRSPSEERVSATATTPIIFSFESGCLRYEYPRHRPSGGIQKLTK